MYAKARDMEFEEAAKLRDKLQKIESHAFGLEKAES
jgi:excinuclease UvrABC helicase subunit UvrB